jgi:hypothetical protein
MECDVVWIGFVDWAGRRRLRDGERALSVREQAAVLAECDIHVTTQGAGANLSAGVGTQTLSLSGCHPCWREGVAYFGNPYIEDPSRRHVEMYRYEREMRVLTYVQERRPAWRTKFGETERDVNAYAHELWDRETPPSKLPAEDRFARVRSLDVEEVAEVLAAMLHARATGRPAPGR